MNKLQLTEFVKAIVDKSVDNVICFLNLEGYEKVDGEAFRLIVHEGRIGVETSYSGPKFDENELYLKSFKETLLHFQTKYRQKLLELSSKYQTDFKVIGELLYCDQVDKDNTFTVVGTKYDASNFGIKGGAIFFKCLGLSEYGCLFLLEPEIEEAILEELKELSDEEFKIYNKRTVKAAYSWNFGNKIKKAYIENPSLIMTLSDEKFKNLRQTFSVELSNLVSKMKPSLGPKESLLEGLVVRVGNNDYAISNFKWNKLKNRHLSVTTGIEDRIKDFYEELFQCRSLKKSLFVLETRGVSQSKFIEAVNRLKQDVQSLVEVFYSFDFSSATPLNVLSLQEQFVLRLKEKVESLNEDPNLLKNLK